MIIVDKELQFRNIIIIDVDLEVIYFTILQNFFYCKSNIYVYILKKIQLISIIKKKKNVTITWDL